MGDLTKDFSRREFACKCGCGFDRIDPRVVAMAQKIRDAIGEPVRINSGCRCTWHNKNEKGVQVSPPQRGKSGTEQDSYHTTGKAVDLSCVSGAFKLFAAAKDLYAKGKLNDLEYCKWYKAKNFVHIDCGKKRNNRFAEE